MRKLVSLFLVLCLMCAAVPAFAEAAETQEVKLSNITFQIPAGLQVTRMTTTGNNYESDTCKIYLVGSNMDADLVRAMMKEVEKQGLKLSFQQAAIGIAEVSEKGGDLAVTLALYAMKEDIGMLNGDPVMCGREALVESCAFYAQHYRGKYYSVLVADETMTPDEIYQLARDIMLSVRIDGVSEEDMIADAQADYVIITADSGKIRTEASISGGLIKTAYKGETYELIEESGDWYIIDVDGRTGYLHTGVAEIQ